jgi:putative membrane protein
MKLRSLFSLTNLTLVAILFHVIGLVGIGVLHNTYILKATPYHLVLMFLLLVISYSDQWKSFWKWMPLVFVLGFGAEWVGIHKHWLFGHYSYANTLGWKWQDIPYVLGANWVIVISGAVCLTCLLTENKWLNSLLAAGLATAYDWLIEPVAMKLHYWDWVNNMIPQLNYICWFGCSFLFALLWHACKNRINQFSINLLIIQALFFAILRGLLK